MFFNLRTNMYHVPSQLSYFGIFKINKQTYDHVTRHPILPILLAKVVVCEFITVITIDCLIVYPSTEFTS